MMLDPNLDTQVALLRADLDELKKDLAKQSNDIQGLVDAWKTASGVLSFVKALSQIIVAVGIIWAVVKFRIFGIPR